MLVVYIAVLMMHGHTNRFEHTNNFLTHTVNLTMIMMTIIIIIIIIIIINGIKCTQHIVHIIAIKHAFQ